ncbi:MAG: ATP-binding cassette domain-containing protein [Actinomycetota bacterium]|nr:ATP-binding cassette domain-containing protein [Actinomycetota bacterium]
MSNTIEADGLVKGYGEVRALDGVSFSVPEGSVFGVLGPNGAGKSTTVRILTTLSRPDEGADREATGRENLRLQGQVYGMGGRELEGRIDELLERFRLADAADRLVRGYSGGMERRLDVALGLVSRPAVLFLDEPTTGLDPEVRAEKWREIESLAGEHGVTVLLTTHYMEEADRLADRLAIVDRGNIVAEGTPDELKRELRGDAVHVELAASANGNARTALDRVDEVHEVVLEGRLLHARADDGARAVPGVLAALDSHGVPVASVTVARPSLEDVYLRHAGQTFEEAAR